MLGNPNTSQGERSLEDTEKRESRGGGAGSPGGVAGRPRVWEALQEAWRLGWGEPGGARPAGCLR